MRTKQYVVWALVSVPRQIKVIFCDGVMATCSSFTRNREGSAFFAGVSHGVEPMERVKHNEEFHSLVFGGT